MKTLNVYGKGVILNTIEACIAGRWEPVFGKYAFLGFSLFAFAIPAPMENIAVCIYLSLYNAIISISIPVLVLPMLCNLCHPPHPPKNRQAFGDWINHYISFHI